MTLSDTRLVAAAIVEQNCAFLRVVGVLPRKGSAYVEVLLDGAECGSDSCRFMLTLDRNAPERFAAVLQEAMLRRLCTPTTRPS